MNYKHLNIQERSCLYTLLNAKLSIREIAKALERNPSTILREIKRNARIIGNGKGYLNIIQYMLKNNVQNGEKNVTGMLNIMMNIVNTQKKKLNCIGLLIKQLIENKVKLQQKQ